jgi:hypothetical protein
VCFVAIEIERERERKNGNKRKKVLQFSILLMSMRVENREVLCFSVFMLLQLHGKRMRIIAGNFLK